MTKLDFRCPIGMDFRIFACIGLDAEIMPRAQRFQASPACLLEVLQVSLVIPVTDDIIDPINIMARLPALESIDAWEGNGTQMPAIL